MAAGTETSKNSGGLESTPRLLATLFTEPPADALTEDGITNWDTICEVNGESVQVHHARSSYGDVTTYHINDRLCQITRHAGENNHPIYDLVLNERDITISGRINEGMAQISSIQAVNMDGFPAALKRAEDIVISIAPELTTLIIPGYCVSDLADEGIIWINSTELPGTDIRNSSPQWQEALNAAGYTNIQKEAELGGQYWQRSLAPTIQELTAFRDDIERTDYETTTPSGIVVRHHIDSLLGDHTAEFSDLEFGKNATVTVTHRRNLGVEWMNRFGQERQANEGYELAICSDDIEIRASVDGDTIYLNNLKLFFQHNDALTPLNNFKHAVERLLSICGASRIAMRAVPDTFLVNEGKSISSISTPAQPDFSDPESPTWGTSWFHTVILPRTGFIPMGKRGTFSHTWELVKQPSPTE